MKKTVIALFLTTGIGFAFPATDLGSNAFYVETNAPTLVVECPSDGILMIGFKVSTTEVFSEGYLYLDDVEIASNESVDYQVGPTMIIAATATTVVPITKGQYEIKAKNNYGNYFSDEIRTWALFWAYDTGSAVAEQPPVSEEDITGSEVHRVGDRISFEYTSTSIYDASGRLVGRMGPGNWIPTSTGIYFITYVKNDQAELKKIVVVN